VICFREIPGTNIICSNVTEVCTRFIQTLHIIRSQLLPSYTLLIHSKVKVNLSLCFNWAPRQENVFGEWRYSSTHSLTSALDGGEWSASRPGRFTSRERDPCTHWIGDWIGLKTVLDSVVKRKIPSTRRELNSKTPIVQSIAQRYTDSIITAFSN
jgi:hypothetical protein